MDGGEHVMIWMGRFISSYSRVGIRVRRYVAGGSHVLDYEQVGP